MGVGDEPERESLSLSLCGYLLTPPVVPLKGSVAIQGVLTS